MKSGCRVAKPRLDVASTELDEDDVDDDDVLFASLDGYDSSDNPRVDVNLKPPTPDDIMDGNSLNSGRCVVDAIVMMTVIAKAVIIVRSCLLRNLLVVNVCGFVLHPQQAVL